MVAISRAVRDEIVNHVHGIFLTLVRRLDAEALGASSGPTAPSIGFHLWHSARWADLLQAEAPGMSDTLRDRLGPSKELWEHDGWAERFGVHVSAPGFRGTGMSAEPEEFAAMPLGDPALVVGYAEAAFGAVDLFLQAIDDEVLTERCMNLYGNRSSVGFVVVGHGQHLSRHLGSVEALIGVSGRPGTASI